MISRYTNSTHRGAALIAGLVGLAVAGIVCVNLLKALAMDGQRMDLAQRQIQADWLVESGLRRAIARLAADSQFEQETWMPLRESLPDQTPASIVIQVEPIADHPGRRSIEVIVVYGERAEHQLRRSKRISLKTKPSGASL